ncbi:MAG: primosomal protein N', partial [Sulfurimonas sp.]|nr:primosomal protein N' [Sulfurimonas sp.]
IFLMPEISLTPQMETRLQKYFGDWVVMWHSKLTPLKKKKALEKIRSGEAKIIAGPRSALFLPIEDLGFIVVDEEHDDSYKSSSRPRYNARDIAIYMGKIYDIPVVLGSATPSLNSYVKFPHARLKGGYFNSNREFIYERSAESLSPLIFKNIEDTLQAKEQTIVFLPTRANFKYLICGDCGHTVKCAFCSIGMSIHQKSRALKCHYCNFTQAIPQVCSECGSPNLTSSRLGTAEATQNISEIFPHAKVEQFDRDVITTQNKLKKALKRFNDNETDILVGTQMLSKGHDYHGVTLAVVLGMDNMLNMSDYRAREKALSSLIQVSGRSGRKKGAKVLVQSFNEEFFSAYVDNYGKFLEEEKFFREGLYPPFKKLCRVLFSHKNGAKAQEQMREMQEKLAQVSNVEIVGFGKCAIERVANKYRFEILLRSDKSTDLIKAVSLCRVALAEIDMDPIEFG